MSTTPSYDSEAERAHDRGLEDSVRPFFEQHGLSCCYPAEPYIDLSDPPPLLVLWWRVTEHILSYWTGLSFSGFTPLCEQEVDMQNFLYSQRSRRKKCKLEQDFAQLVTTMQERRKEYNLQGDVHLSLDTRQQSRLQTWLEYQDYHLREQERLEQDVKLERQQLDQARTESRSSAIEAHTYRFAVAEGKSDEHGTLLLPWIEQQRLQMAQQQPEAPAEMEGLHEPERPETAVHMLATASKCGRQLRPRPGRVPSKSQAGPQSRPSRRTPRPKTLKTPQRAVPLRDAITTTRSGRVSKRPDRLGFA